MKRSEMIKRLAVDIKIIRSTELSEATDDRLANILLDHIVEYGMIEPECGTDWASDFDDASEHKPIYGWEPEE
jgi:hypothetical protein